MKKKNYQLLKELIYKNSHLNFKKSKKKNNMQTLNLRKLNKRSLKFFNMRYLNNNNYKLNKFILQKVKKQIKKKKNIKEIFFSLIWDDLLLFFSKNSKLINKLLVKVNNINLFDIVLNLYLNYGFSKYLRFKLFRLKKKNKSLLFSRKSFFKYFIYFFNNYLNLNEFNFNFILNFIYKNLNNQNLLINLKLVCINTFVLKNIKNLRFFLVKKKKSKAVLRSFTLRRKWRRNNILFSKIYLKINKYNKLKKNVKSYNKFLKYKIKKKIQRKSHFDNILKQVVTAELTTNIIIENNIKFLYNEKKYLNILKTKINFTNYRWRFKEYLCLFFQDLNLLKKKYILSYYFWLNLIRKQIYNIKFMFLYFKNLLKNFDNLKNNINSLSLNIKLNIKKNIYILIYKNIYIKFINILKYYNKFLNVLQINLNLKIKVQYNKDLLKAASMVNIIDNSVGITPVTIIDYFWSRYKFSKNVAVILRDRLFNKIKVFSNNTSKIATYNNSFLLQDASVVNSVLNNTHNDLTAINYNNAYFFSNNSKINNYNYLFLLQMFLFYFNFFFKYKQMFLFYFNSLQNLNKFNYLNTISNYSKLVTLGVNSTYLNIKLKSNLYLLYKTYLNISLFSDSNLIKFFIFFNIILKQLKIKFLNYLKYKNLIFIFFIIVVEFNIFSIFKFLSFFFKNKKFNILTNIISIFKNINKNYVKNRFFFFKFLNNNYLKDNNYYLKSSKYDFFVNLKKNYIYSNYSKKRNLNNDKKCILYYVEKKSNVFLVLSKLNNSEVIGHISGGQGMDRDFVNSKRQKKGTRSLTISLEKKLKSKVKKYKLKKLYIVAQGVLNFRVSHLMKHWVVRYKLGIQQLKGVKFLFRSPHHKGLKKSNKRRK